MAAEKGDALFVSQLDDKSKAKARKELHELNDKDRVLAVQTLRRWVQDQNWLKCPTDFEFLLRFLRVRKFSQLGARQTIENYWACKENMPAFYRNIDPADPILRDVIKSSKFFFSHKKLDKDGHRYIFIRPGALSLDQVKQIGLPNLYKGFVTVLEWAMFDENTQVNGVKMVCDYTNMNFQLYLAYANFEDQKNLMKFLQKSLPVRLKKMFYYNEPAFIDVLLAFLSPILTQKFRQRIELLGNNLVALYKVIEKSHLPDEYLPDDHTGPSAGPIDKIVDEMLDDMTNTKFREYIRDVSSTKYGVDLKKKADVEQEPTASFRKLNVD